MAKYRAWHLKLSRSKKNDPTEKFIYQIDLDLPDGLHAAIDFPLTKPIDFEEESPVVDALDYCERILKAMGVKGRCIMKIKGICEVPFGI